MVMKLQFHLGLAKATSGMVKNPSAYAFQTKMSSKVATDSAVFGTHAIFERNRLGLGRGGFLEIEGSHGLSLTPVQAEGATGEFCRGTSMAGSPRARIENLASPQIMGYRDNPSNDSLAKGDDDQVSFNARC